MSPVSLSLLLQQQGGSGDRHAGVCSLRPFGDGMAERFSLSMPGAGRQLWCLE